MLKIKTKQKQNKIYNIKNQPNMGKTTILKKNKNTL